MTRAVTALALAGLLVLAGCAAPTPPAQNPAESSTTTGPEAPQTTTTDDAQSATTTATESDATGATSADIEVENGSLPFNATHVFYRVTTLLGTDVEPPERIQILPADAMSSEPRGLPRFARTMGIGNGDTRDRVETAGITQGRDYVALNARIAADEDRARGVLVHEFVHVVQFSEGSIDTTYTNIQPGSTDTQMTYLAVIEGIPVFVEDRYAHEYGDGAPTGMDGMLRGYRRATGVRKYALAPYAFGATYAAERAGSAKRVDDIYQNPPSTTEAIIHGYGPGEEPVRSLSVDTSGETWRWSDRDRLGELFVRQVLTTELAEDRAATAAAGWGVDRQLTFERGSEIGYVWALRWDSVSDAAEFERATRDYLDARGERQSGTWRVNGTTYDVVRTSPEVVVLVIGPKNFTDGTNVSGGNSSVSIETPAAS